MTETFRRCSACGVLSADSCEACTACGADIRGALRVQRAGQSQAVTTAETNNQVLSDVDARIEECDRLMRACGQLVPESYADSQGQHVGIASCREVIAARLKELLAMKREMVGDNG